MHILIVIGAGASFDAWPKHVPKPGDYPNYRLPLAKELFSPYQHQSHLLQEYNLLDIASLLRAKANILGDKFDIEDELLKISLRADKKNDINTLLSLFKTRFYLQNLINTLTKTTLQRTVGHTEYIDLVRKLKYWIEDSPDTRAVDIVNFNYDTLLEKAMKNNYSVDWRSKNEDDQMSAYYSGRNLRIYKPHGSIDWGRVVIQHGTEYSYGTLNKVFREFHSLTPLNTFRYINPEDFSDSEVSKNVIPAIAIPLKEKTNFDECPQFMQQAMLEAVNNADYIITLGWKGAEKHFTKLLSDNSNNVKDVYVVSPSATTELSSIFPPEKIKPFASTFGHFVSQTEALEGILEKFKEQ